MQSTEERKEYCKRWRASNIEKCRQSAKAWRAANVEKRRKYQKKYGPEYSKKRVIERRAIVKHTTIIGDKTKIKFSSDVLVYLSIRLIIDETSATGLRWQDVESNRSGHRNKEAGCFDKSGYIYLTFTFNSCKYKINVATIVWMLFHNKLIEGDKIVNHKNRIRWDNRIQNLELATTSENCVNRTSLSPYGYKNIVFNSIKNRFHFRFTWKGCFYTSSRVAKFPGHAFVIAWEFVTLGKVPLGFIKSQSDEWKDGSYLQRALAECKKQGIAVKCPKYKTLYEYIASVEGSC